MTKKCTVCQLELDVSSFHKRTRAKDGLSSCCKKCHSDRVIKQRKHQHSLLNKIQRRIQLQKRRQRNREIINNLRVLGCSLCPENDPTCIDFHHCYDKESNIASLMNRSPQYIMRELAKCIRVCANCHRKIHGGSIKVGGSEQT